MTSHRHTNHCHWDHEEATWICERERPLVDTRDMIVVHTALLREFRLAPAAVARVEPGDRPHARAVARHLDLICDMLDHHHSGEHDLLWPPLRGRVPSPATDVIDQAERQHAEIDRSSAAVRSALSAWVDQPDEAQRRELADKLTGLHRVLAAHLDMEERALLPLAAAHLAEDEWRAIGKAGAAATPRKMMPLVFGMFSYEGDPAVLSTMLTSAPAPVRVLVPRIAPRVYERRARRVHGTPRP